MNEGIKNKIIVLLGVLGVSFSAILVRFSNAPSRVLVLYRIGLAAVIMAVPGVKSIKAESRDITKTDILCCCISGVFLAFHFYAFFTAVKLTTVSAATVLVNTEVLFVSFALVFLFHQSISKKNMLGIGLTFLGSVIIALGDSGGVGSLTGDIWALSGGFFVAVYTLMGRICRKHMSTNSYTFIVYTVTALTSYVLLTIQGIPAVGYRVTDIRCAFGMTVLCTLLGHSIFSWALKYESPAFISSAKLLEPVFSSILAVFIFTEIPAVSTAVGGIIIITGILLAG